VVLAGMPKYVGSSAAIAIMAVQLSATAQYWQELKRGGTGLIWTDAIFPLSEELKQAEGGTVFITDWGIFDSLHLLHKGRLHLRIASGPLTPEYPTQAEVEDIHRMFQTPGGVWVSHIKGEEITPNVGEHLDALVAAAGKHRKLLKTIRDSHGRPVFEISQIE
jgi:hypothetical protein